MAELLSPPIIVFELVGAMRGVEGAPGTAGTQGLPGLPGLPGINGTGVPIGGLAGQFLVKNSNTDFDTAWTGVVGQASIHQVTQAAHGFTKGQIIKYSGSGYSYSKANNANAADVVGMVYEVQGVNSFSIITEGWVDGLTGLTPGNLFLSPITAGGITATDPADNGVTGQVRKPVFFAVNETSGYFHNYEGIVIGAASYGGSTPGGGTVTQNVRIAFANTTVDDTDDIVVQTTDFTTVTMHDAGTALVKKYTIHNASDEDIEIFGNLINGSTSYILYPSLTVDLLPVAGNFRII